ncbi:hypothetical protein V6N13_139872 [Hibiscus sabdariffa]
MSTLTGGGSVRGTPRLALVGVGGTNQVPSKVGVQKQSFRDMPMGSFEPPNYSDVGIRRISVEMSFITWENCRIPLILEILMNFTVLGGNHEVKGVPMPVNLVKPKDNAKAVELEQNKILLKVVTKFNGERILGTLEPILNRYFKMLFKKWNIEYCSYGATHQWHFG